VPDPDAPPTTGPTDPTDPADPADPDPDGTAPTNEPIGEPDPDAIDFGPNKPARRYDEFLLAVVTDLEQWWAQEYPVHYGTPFEPLQGSIYAAYPERPDDIPGCGTERTTYPDVQQYVAFYCSDGDFFVYDDGDGGLLTELADDYGASTIGTVFAHEFGHAVQLRIGAIDRGLPTITTEQQADCFAGAWTARVADGGSTLVEFTDDDVRAGLIAMTKVSDPVGIDQFEPGGHGSAFDRVGAFQVGFTDGLDRCTQLLDDPLPLVPNLLSADEVTTGGDAEFGYGEGQLLGFIPTDLNAYWDEELDADVPDLDTVTFTVVDGADDVSCEDLRGDLDQGAAWCATTHEVYFNEPVALELYTTLGDFAVGYVLGNAWSEAVQDALGSDLEGTARSLLNDCLTGGWVKTVISTDEDGDGFYELPQPRLESRMVRVSAGDLDEAIQTVLLVADPTSGIDGVGSAFDKIAAFRSGVLDGTDSCLDQL
jgi:predicted metalloprotease